MVKKFFLVVRADGTARIISGRLTPRLKDHEFAFPVRVTIPELWGSVLAKSLDITIPGPTTEPTATVEE
jgi:hypothetical protein